MEATGLAIVSLLFTCFSSISSVLLLDPERDVLAFYYFVRKHKKMGKGTTCCFRGFRGRMVVIFDSAKGTFPSGLPDDPLE